MRRLRLVATLIVCFVSLWLTTAKVSAEQIILPITGRVYHMISSPYMPEDRDPKASLVDDLGPYKNKRKRARWRLFHYAPGEGGYAELKSPKSDPNPIKWDSVRDDFEFGRGYWIITRKSKEIGIEGEPVLENWIKLEHEGDGWNQIGNIFDYDFPIVSLYVALESTPWDQKQLIDEVNNDLTYVTLQEFEDGSYIDIPATGKTTLEVGKGYWLKVKANVTEPVRLWFVVRQSSPLSEEIYLSEGFFERVAQQESPPDPPPAVESSSSVSFTGGSSGGSGGCFVATVAYGDYDHPSVQHLREFRDRYLLTNSFGRMFVGNYYRYSPALARFAAHREPIKVLARFTLTPVIGLSHVVSKINPYSFFVIVASGFLGSLFLFRRGWGGDANQNFRERKKKEK